MVLLSRLSEKGAKLIATTNPDSPTNYVYTNIIQNNEINKAVHKFHLFDNTFLDKDYVKQIQKNIQAFISNDLSINGDFVRAEGTIFLDFADNPQDYISFADVPKRFKWVDCAYDLGGNGSAYGP